MEESWEKNDKGKVMEWIHMVLQDEGPGNTKAKLKNFSN
jgi:hypothetical protein